MAQRRGHGSAGIQSDHQWHATRRGSFPAAGQYCPAWHGTGRLRGVQREGLNRAKPGTANSDTLRRRLCRAMRPRGRDPRGPKGIGRVAGENGTGLHPSKTRVTHTLRPTQGQAGFDFLGFHVRQYAVGRTHSGKSPQGRTLGFKTIIKPSKESVKRHIAELGRIVQNHKSVPQAVLIQHLNPVVRGWANYYRTVVAKVALHQCDHHLYSQLRRWALRRHPRKPRRWVAQRYWRMQPGAKWEFEAKQNGEVIARLLTHRKTPIKRHVKVKGSASPFDGNLVYWSQRLKEHPLLAREEGKLLQRQQGRCMRCGRLFMEEDVREMDHIIPRAVGGSNLLLNKQLLHGHCHDQKHGQQANGCS